MVTSIPLSFEIRFDYGSLLCSHIYRQKTRLVIKHQCSFSRRPALTARFPTFVSLWRRPSAAPLPHALPPIPHAVSMGSVATSEGLRPLARHRKTHILCNEALGCRRLPPRFSLLRAEAPSPSLLGMKFLMLYTYIERLFFFFF